MTSLEKLNLQSFANMAEKLCLQWNDFRQNISASFADLRGDKEFSDVTLACEDGHQVEAHKVILASSSPVFKELLRKNKHPHPLLYMRALKSEDLVAIMDFLYFGEANIFQENLDSFLALAEELQLKGLTTGADGVRKEEKIKVPPKNQSFKREKSQIIPNPTFNPDEENFADLDTRIAVMNENTPISADLQGLDQQIRSMITRNDTSVQSGSTMRKMATCNICGKEGPYISMPRHIEANHITGVSHACEIYGTNSRSKHGLKQHKLKHHNGDFVVSGPGML